MPLSYQQPSPTKGKSRQAEGGGGASGGNTKQNRFGNGFLMQQVIGKAAKDSGGSVDWGRSLGKEDPGKNVYPEGPGDSTAQGTGAQGGRKEQKDALPALREKHAGKSYEDVKDGKAFVQGSGDEKEVDPNDVAQGQLGDCYLMAGMAAVARANPDQLKKIIKDNGDGTFNVTLYIRKNPYSAPTPVTKTVDARLPSSGGGSTLYAGTGDKAGGATEMWPALLEKTVAQHKGSYEEISGGNIGKGGFNFAGATEMFTGKAEGYKNVDNLQEDDILLELGAALEAKRTCTVDSRDMTNNEALSKESTPYNVYGNHAYAVQAVDIDKRTVDLQNPWGSHHVKALPIALFKKFYRGIRIGG